MSKEAMKIKVNNIYIQHALWGNPERHKAEGNS